MLNAAAHFTHTPHIHTLFVGSEEIRKKYLLIYVTMRKAGMSFECRRRFLS